MKPLHLMLRPDGMIPGPMTASEGFMHGTGFVPAKRILSAAKVFFSRSLKTTFCSNVFWIAPSESGTQQAHCLLKQPQQLEPFYTQFYTH